VKEDDAATTSLGDDDFLRALQLEMRDEADRLQVESSVDLWFYVYLRRYARFGFFSFGPVTIDVRLIGDVVERTGRHRLPGSVTVYGDDFIKFSVLVADEVHRSGERRVDELHVLLAFARVEDGLPARVFGELGVSREAIDEYVRLARERSRRTGGQGEERLYSPEEAARYLGVRVETVRAWIRSGRLRASRLAGQRVLRITASDLRSVLEPVELGDG
jgi:excisionase family DNA binding protein